MDFSKWSELIKSLNYVATFVIKWDSVFDETRFDEEIYLIDIFIRLPLVWHDWIDVIFIDAQVGILVYLQDPYFQVFIYQNVES